MQTEIEFSLPRGLLDKSGQVHRQGKMRLALAYDEIEANADPRVIKNESYLPVVLLSRVITQIGSVKAITPDLVEKMFASDLSYLQDLYMHLNSGATVQIGTVCPSCKEQFRVQISPLG